jgi:hypothetical protein
MNRKTLNWRPLRGDVPYSPPANRAAIDPPPRRGLRAALDAAAFRPRWPLVITARAVFWLGLAVVWVLAIALVPSCVKAGDLTAGATRLVATLGAWHPDRDYAEEKGLQSFTPGIGLEHQLHRDWMLAAGYYRNSYDRDSVYLAAAWQPLRWRALRAGLLAGAVTGYPIAGGGVTDVAAFGGAVVSFVGEGRLGANLIATPRIAEKSHGAVALQLTWRV